MEMSGEYNIPAPRQQVWEARREYFKGDFPVSTLLEISKLVHPAMLVEIEAVGILGAGAD